MSLREVTHAVIEHFAVVVIEGERDFCGEDPNPYVVALTCALASHFTWAYDLEEGWAPLAKVAHFFGVESEPSTDLVATVVLDALDEQILDLRLRDLDAVTQLSEFALICKPALGRRLLSHIERWLDSPEIEQL